MTRPTCVTFLGDKSIGLQVTSADQEEQFLKLGFKKLQPYEDVWRFESSDEAGMYKMCETLRDLGVPYATHRHMGADYQLEWLRDKGYVHGKFKRINFFGNDTDEDAPFAIEEF
jgi:hypothetical protein